MFKPGSRRERKRRGIANRSNRKIDVRSRPEKMFGRGQLNICDLLDRRLLEPRNMLIRHEAFLVAGQPNE
ncbi:MAG: hypothetical protein AB7U97_26025 [Pirellulales bacterium]